jgi:hypothetical protein
LCPADTSPVPQSEDGSGSTGRSLTDGEAVVAVAADEAEAEVEDEAEVVPSALQDVRVSRAAATAAAPSRRREGMVVGLPQVGGRG